MYSGHERFCAKCPYKVGLVCPHIQACHAAYIRGYMKGAKVEKDIALQPIKEYANQSYVYLSQSSDYSRGYKNGVAVVHENMRNILGIK